MVTLVKRMWAEHAILMSVLGVGLLVRLIFLQEMGGTGFKIVDEQHYYQLASSIFSGLGFAWGPDRPTSIRPPLYPGFLYMVWTLVGEKSLYAVRAVQVVISLANVVLLYHLARRLFNQRVAHWAAAIFCLYPSMIAFNFLLLTEVLFTFLVTLFALAYVILLQSHKGGVALGAGLALGLAALTRSILWPLPLVLCPLMLFTLPGKKTTRLKLAALLFLGYAMIVAPWAVRNTNLQGVVTVVNTMGGLTLLMGNYEHTPVDRAWDPSTLRGEHSIFENLKTEHPESVDWTEGQKEKWAQKKAVAFILENPGLTIKRSLIKWGSFWGLERTILAGFHLKYYDPPRWFALLTTVMIPLSYTLVMILACLGIFLAIPEDRRAHGFFMLLLLFVSGLHALVFGHSRYHLPLMPLLIVYAASAIASKSWNQLRHGLPKVVGPVAASVGLIVVWSREVFVVEGERIRVFVQSLFG